MLSQVPALLDALKCEHEWLSAEAFQESKDLAARSQQTRRQHHVPRMYLERWALSGLVQPVQVDGRIAHPPQPPKNVARKNNFYTLPDTETAVDTPLRWIETHLSRIESQCANRLAELDRWSAGLISDGKLKCDLSVFLGLQVTRSVGSRERTTALIHAPDTAKRAVLEAMWPAASRLQIDRSMSNRFEDPKEEALDLMVKDVRNVLAGALFQREWALYSTATPIVTCDEPVVFVSGPPFDRDRAAGAVGSAAILFPVNPHCLLVMLRPGLNHRGPYQLTFAESRSINIEIAAAASRTAFERPGDAVLPHITLPPRPSIPVLQDDAAAVMSAAEALAVVQTQAAPRSRWRDVDEVPDWPVPRWYA